MSHIMPTNEFPWGCNLLTIDKSMNLIIIWTMRPLNYTEYSRRRNAYTLTLPMVYTLLKYLSKNIKGSRHWNILKNIKKCHIIVWLHCLCCWFCAAMFMSHDSLFWNPWNYWCLEGTCNHQRVLTVMSQRSRDIKPLLQHNSGNNLIFVPWLRSVDTVYVDGLQESNTFFSSKWMDNSTNVCVEHRLEFKYSKWTEYA